MVAGMAFLALAGPLAVWSWSGLETTLFALIIGVLVVTLLDADSKPFTDRVLLVSIVAAFLCRIDGFVWCAAMILPVAVLAPISPSRVAKTRCHGPGLLASYTAQIHTPRKRIAIARCELPRGRPGRTGPRGRRRGPLPGSTRESRLRPCRPSSVHLPAPRRATSRPAWRPRERAASATRRRAPAPPSKSRLRRTPAPAAPHRRGPAGRSRRYSPGARGAACP